MVAAINHAPVPSSDSPHSDFNFLQICMSAYKMLFVADTASFQSKGGILGSIGKTRGFQGSLCNICTYMHGLSMVIAPNHLPDLPTAQFKFLNIYVKCNHVWHEYSLHKCHLVTIIYYYNNN